MVLECLFETQTYKDLYKANVRGFDDNTAP